MSESFPSSEALLWEHKDPTSTRIWEFKTLIEKKYDIQLQDYEALREWSITHIADFWREVWYFTAIRVSKPFEEVALLIGELTLQRTEAQGRSWQLTLQCFPVHPSSAVLC